MDLSCVVCVCFLLRVGLIGLIVDFFPGPNDVLVAEKIVEAVEKERFSSLSLLRTALPSVLIKKDSICLRSSW